MQMSKSNIVSIKDLILAENSHDILELPRKKEEGVQLPFKKLKGLSALELSWCLG